MERFFLSVIVTDEVIACPVEDSMMVPAVQLYRDLHSSFNNDYSYIDFATRVHGRVELKGVHLVFHHDHVCSQNWIQFTLSRNSVNLVEAHIYFTFL